MQIKTILTAAACAASLLTFSGTAASAATVLDQANDVGGNVSFNGTMSWQQQIVAGVTGTLQEIQLRFGGVGMFDVFVNLGSGWQSDADDFVTTITSAADYVSIDVSAANINLTSGDSFMIGIRNGTSSADVRGTSLSSYSAGALFLEGSAFTLPSYDLNFRTFVAEPAPVPLPAGLPLMLLGLGALGAMRKARKA